MGLFDLFKKEETKLAPVNAEDNDIVAMADGSLIDIATVSDPVFAEKTMGDGVAFRYQCDSVIICAPANGELTAFFPTGHAFGITTQSGVELLVHIGINTVEARGDGFTKLSKKQGDQVRAGDPIVKADLKKLSASYDMPVMLIVTNANEQKITFIGPQEVTRGQTLLAK